MAGEVQICNGSLVLLGYDPIMVLDNTTDEGFWCEQLYPQCRDAVCRLVKWACLKEKAVLARLGESPQFGYAHAYQLPPDCLRVWEVNGASDTEKNPGWERVGATIETDANEAKLVYGVRTSNTALFDPLLIEVISAYLAWKLSYKLTGSKKKVAEMLVIFKDSLTLAKGVDGMESREAPPAEQTSSYVTARG